MPHIQAVIRRAGGKFTVMFGVRTPSSKVFADFAEAYREACKYTNWDYNWVKVDILEN